MERSAAAAAAAATEVSRALGTPEVTASAALAAGLPYDGDLSTDGPLRLHYLAAANQANGLLELDTEHARFRLHFKKGVVEHASSDAPDDDLGRFLVAKGTVARQAVEDANQLKDGFGGDLVAALTHLQLLNPAESFRVLQEHGLAVVVRALSSERGRCIWTPRAPLPASSFPLGSRWGTLCDAARRLDGLAIRKLLGDRAHRSASRSGGRVEVSELRLNAQEARAAGLFDGQKTPTQLAASMPAEAETILRVALLLAETELLVFGQRRNTPPPIAQTTQGTPRPSPRAPPSTPARTRSTPAPTARAAEPAKPSSPPASPRPSASPARPPPAGSTPPVATTPAQRSPVSPAPQQKPQAQHDEASLRATYDRVHQADHFEALGVNREATTAQIKVAYFHLARMYHPDAGPTDESAVVKKLRADIFARVGEAWGVLQNEEERARYIKDLAAGGVGTVDMTAIFKAEELFQKGTLLVKARAYDRALESFTEATKLNAEEPEFGVWIAWVEFLQSTDRKKQQLASTQIMEEALKKVPRCMPAYLFLGQMAKIVGDLSLAEKHFKRGLSLEPEQPDLVRELKYLRK